MGKFTALYGLLPSCWAPSRLHRRGCSSLQEQSGHADDGVTFVKKVPGDRAPRAMSLPGGTGREFLGGCSFVPRPGHDEAAARIVVRWALFLGRSSCEFIRDQTTTGTASLAGLLLGNNDLVALLGTFTRRSLYIQQGKK